MLAVDVVGPIPGRGESVPCSTCSGRGSAPRLRHLRPAEASSAPSWAARVVSRAAVGLLNILLEDARFLLAVVICVRERVKLCRGDAASTRECEGKRTRIARNLRQSAVTSVRAYAARIIAAPSAVSSLYFRTFSEPAATTTPRARASAAAPATVERADEALLYARLGLPIVVGDIKYTREDIGNETAPNLDRTRRRASRRPARARSCPVVLGAACVERTRRVDAVAAATPN